MFLCGAENLASNKNWINELNVFPVPDGDTGTNMTMTVVSAVNEVISLGETNDMKAVCKAISSGSLRGARGNSGVILSQLLRGFCKIVRDHAEIDVPMAADAFDKAVETAYKAVMKPKEGTILTVAKGAAVKARELADGGTTDFEVFIPEVIQYADSVLASTPDMLPVLKQAGVVDSGGQGLVQVLKGAYEGLQGKTADIERILHPEEHEDEKKEEPKKEYKYLYSVSFVILLDNNFNPKMESDLKSYLSSIGENVITSVGDQKISVHLYTNDPGLALQKKIPVMDTPEKEAEAVPGEKKQPESPRKEIGIVAVAAGEGLAQIFRSLGADYVISGGQTMNPSTADILDAADKVNADTVFILPNNKNIILAANQAAAIDGDKTIVVIPTKNIPQGITAVINFMPDQSADVNKDNMLEEISGVKSAEITYAVRDTVIDDVEIKEGNMMAIGDSGILGVGTDRNDTAMEALSKIVGDTTELISIYYGADTTKEQAQDLHDRAASRYPGCEVEVSSGGQPVYYYILSAE